MILAIQLHSIKAFIHQSRWSNKFPNAFLKSTVFSTRRVSPNVRFPLNTNKNSNQTPQKDDNATPKSTFKRKVLLVGGYLGSNYHGLQMDATKVNDPNAVPTIENEIRLAMLKAGLTIPSNGEDLSKIGWSRSSRTDKRVHAGRIVFSGKLEIPAHLLADVPSGDPQQNPSEKNSMNYPVPGLIEAKKGKGPHYQPQIYAANEPNTQFKPIFFPEIVKKLNEQLPVDIRVYSCMKTTGNFQAKDAGYWREYEYLLPLSLLIPEANSSKDINEVDIVNRFNSFLMNYEGIHYFHNFHRISMKELFKKDRGKNPFQSKEAIDSRRDNTEKIQADNQDEYTDDNSGEEDEEPEPKTTVPRSTDEGQQFDGTSRRNFFYEKWQEIPRPLHAKVRSTIYRCRASLNTTEIVTSEGRVNEKYVKVTIIGQFFLLHQIRLMMSAGIMCIRGILPEFFIPMALRVPTFFHLPLAPPNGLVLVNAGFYGNALGANMAMSENTRTLDDDIILLNHEENQKSQDFLENKIYPCILSDWQRNSSALSQEFIDYLGKFTVPDEVMNRFTEIQQQSQQSRIEETNVRKDRENARLFRMFSEFRQKVESFRGKIPRKELRKLQKDYGPQEFLPNTLHSLIIIHYQLYPSEFVLEILTGLASRVMYNQTMLSWKVTDFVELLDQEISTMFTAEERRTIATKDQLKQWLSKQTIHPFFKS